MQVEFPFNALSDRMIENCVVLVRLVFKSIKENKMNLNELMEFSFVFVQC